MGHETVGGGDVPVLLAGLEEHAVAGADDLDGASAPLREADALGDVDALTVGMRVPGGARARREMDTARAQTRSARRCRDRVDVDLAGEPVARPGHRLDGVSRDLHARPPVGRDPYDHILSDL